MGTPVVEYIPENLIFFTVTTPHEELSPIDPSRRFKELAADALLYHGFTNYMRDYEMFVYQSTDPRSGIEGRHLRLLFRLCPEACVRSLVMADVWPDSTDDHLLEEHHVARDSPKGYVWGVQCQVLYPGATIVEDSERARAWTERLGISFHEVSIKATAHQIDIVFSELRTEEVGAGYAPFEIERDGIAETYESGSKIPLPPDGPTK